MASACYLTIAVDMRDYDNKSELCLKIDSKFVLVSGRWRRRIEPTLRGFRAKGKGPSGPSCLTLLRRAVGVARPLVVDDVELVALQLGLFADRLRRRGQHPTKQFVFPGVTHLGQQGPASHVAGARVAQGQAHICCVVVQPLQAAELQVARFRDEQAAVCAVADAFAAVLGDFELHLWLLAAYVCTLTGVNSCVKHCYIFLGQQDAGAPRAGVVVLSFELCEG